jgi:hypothetical protein
MSELFLILLGLVFFLGVPTVLYGWKSLPRIFLSLVITGFAIKVFFFFVVKQSVDPSEFLFFGVGAFIYIAFFVPSFEFIGDRLFKMNAYNERVCLLGEILLYLMGACVLLILTLGNIKVFDPMSVFSFIFIFFASSGIYLSTKKFLI